MTDNPKGSLPEKEQLNVINAITFAVAQSIELDTVLNTALEKVMELFDVDHGGIYLVDFDSGRLKLAASHGLTAGFLAEKSDVPPGSGCAGWAVDSRQIFAAFEKPEAGYVCRDAERLMGIDCLFASPLVTKTGVQGVIELFAPASRRLTADEASLVKVISDQIGIAVENARLFDESRLNVLKLTQLQKELAISNRRLAAHLTQELHIAEMLQKSLLPRKLPRIPGIEIATRLISATAAADVGGDFYDFIESDESPRLAVVVGDVCGSGIEAATLTGITKSTLRAFVFEKPEVASALERSNRVLHTQADPAKFVAIFLGFLDPATLELEYCVAGQPVPQVLRDGRIIELRSGSMPLGVERDAVYEKATFQLERNDTLVMFTDGLIEARRDANLFGFENVQRIIREHAEDSLDNLVDRLLVEAREFGGGSLRDDVAVVAMRFKG